MTGTHEQMGRPKLPSEALQRIREAEEAASIRLGQAVVPYTPRNPTLVYLPVEITAVGWKVIDHLLEFADAIFDAQAKEYLARYPELVEQGNLLQTEVGQEVISRTTWKWAKWETTLDLELRRRWTPEYYRAYLEEASQPGSEDRRQLEHFEARLREAVAERVSLWQRKSKEDLPRLKSIEIPEWLRTVEPSEKVIKRTAEKGLMDRHWQSVHALSRPTDESSGMANPSRREDVLRAQTAPVAKESRKAKNPARRNVKYEGIDRALSEISEARPKNHEEVFRFLDDRRVAIPNREPFKFAGGWLKGSQQNRHDATAWLSQTWGRLGLPAFAPGPKK